MVKEVLTDILWSASYFVFNPLLWIALAMTVLLGYFRVKRERKSFRVRMLPGLTELKRIVSESWLHAIILSILISGIGLIVDIGWLVSLSLVSIILLLTFNFKLTSPIYVVALSIGGLYALQYFVPQFEYKGWQVQDIDFLGPLVMVVSIIAGLLLIAEGRLITKYAVRNSSTYLIQTSRGLKAGLFKVKRLWLLPVLFIVPGDMVSAYLPYWPQFTVDEKAFSFIPIPFIIGFSQIVRSKFPEELFPQVGRAILLTGVVVCSLSVAAIWVPVFSWIALLVGIVSRMGISIVTSIRERKGSMVLSPKSEGIVVAGIVPNSPGEKLGLIPGETIRSVNGQAVHSEKELYAAIQVNAAHCRLQIIDRNGEVRLMQQVVYHHDHHRLGILVVQ